MFLDTARLGRMSPRAQSAHADLGRLAAAEGASPAFERFLLAGFDDPADAIRYPGLGAWRGIGGLKASLRALAGGPLDLPVLLAGRSAALMRLAARLLFHPCRNVLTADLGWPGYHGILEGEARRAGRVVSSVGLLDDALAGSVGVDDVVDRIRSAYLAHGCDGLFLPAVSSHGIRLPVAEAVRAIEAVREPRFVVADGAQEYCHAPSAATVATCDLYLAGCHKWLGAYHPMGLAFYGRERSASVIDALVAHLRGCGSIDDPLHHFVTGLGTGDVSGIGETVNLAPLFTSQAAASAAIDSRSPQRFGVRLDNTVRAAAVVREAGWEPYLPDVGLRSGILLVRAARAAARGRSADETRAAFTRSGLVISAYQGGLVRLSMPDAAWSEPELHILSAALKQCA